MRGVVVGSVEVIGSMLVERNVVSSWAPALALLVVLLLLSIAALGVVVISAKDNGIVKRSFIIDIN